MPYSTRRRFTRRTRRPTRSTRSVARTARVALSLARRVSRRQNVEFKYYDNVQTAQEANTTGTVYRLDAVPQGDTGSSRDGDQIRAKSLLMRLNLTYSDSSAAAINNPFARVRAIVVADHNTTGTPMTATDLLVSVDVDSFNNLYNRRRFRVMMDRIFILGNHFTSATTVNTNLPCVRYCTKYWKIDQTKVYESGSTDVQSGTALYLIIFSDMVTAECPVFDLSTRIRYIDN